jgi:hypothetical protein
VAGKVFDVALLDGNHEGEYLRREISKIVRILKLGGLIVLDDVDAHWIEIQEVFQSLGGLGFEIVGTDGRVGVAKLTKT